MSATIGEAYLAITQIDNRITKLGQELLGLENERRSHVVQARLQELREKPEEQIFKIRYHHAVEDVHVAEKKVESAGKAHKEAKDVHEKSLELLTKLEEETDEQKRADAEERLPLVQQSQRGSTTNEGWRELPLSALGLSAAIVEKLSNPIHKASDQKLKEITTLGGLVDLTANTPYSLLKGISSTTSGKIEDAWMKFWEENPKYCQPPLIDQVDTEVEPIKPEVELLLTHGATKNTVKALRAAGHTLIEQVTEFINDDDICSDVVGKKGVKNLRLAMESWGAMQ